jgi:hypothetical protein
MTAQSPITTLTPNVDTKALATLFDVTGQRNRRAVKRQGQCIGQRDPIRRLHG